MARLYKNPNSNSPLPLKAEVSFSQYGVRKRKTKIFATEKAAKKWIIQMEAAHLSGTNFFKEDMLLADYFWQWFVLFKQPVVSPATADTYTVTLKHVRRILPKVRMRDASKPMMQQYFNLLGMARESAKKQLTQLRQAFRYAVEEGVISKNPLAGHINIVADAGKTKGDDAKYMPRSDFKKVTKFLLEYQYTLSDVNRAVLMLISQSGLRAGEAIALKTDDLDFDKCQITVDQSFDSKHQMVRAPKTSNAHRTVRVPVRGMRVIQRWVIAHRQWLFAQGVPNRENFIFLKRDGRLPESKNLNASYHQLQRKLGIEAKFSTHTMRHTLASMMIQDGVNLNYVSRFLGHSSTAITQQYYVSILPDDIDTEATKAMKIISGE